VRIIKTSSPLPKDRMGQLALYNGMDVLTLFEIRSAILAEMSSAHLCTYNFEMDLQSPLIEMAFNSIHVDTFKRQELISEHEQEQAKIGNYIHQLAEAIGYYDYYKTIARASYASVVYEDIEAIPSSWTEWLALPISTRRNWKILSSEGATKQFQKAIKEFDKPFNPTSSQQKTRLFYHFFGVDTNEVSRISYPNNPPPWGRTKGLVEIKTRSTNGEYTPGTDRDCLEKLAKRASNDQSTAAYWALPFLNLCMHHADLTKTLQFLNCKLEKGKFYSSFGAVTETGRLSSKKSNFGGLGWNAQNVTPKLRVIFTCPPGWKMATPDYEQIESRMVAARCFLQFGAVRYLAASSCGDLHSLACSMVWESLPWPEDFTVEWTIKHGPFPKDMIVAAKKLANQEAYRGKSRRDCSKTLGHGCLTEDHEVLTPTGWEPICNKPQVIMQSDGTFVRVSNWIDKLYCGKFVHWEGQSISALMTGDHRVYYEIDSSGIKIKPALEIPKSAKIPLNFPYRGGLHHEPLARLLAAYHCDGHWPGYNQTEFHFYKERKIKRIYELAAEVGIEEAPRADPTKVVLKWVPKIHEPDWSMLTWDKKSLSAYMDELKYWDGHQAKAYTTLSSVKLDWLNKWQTFNRLLGHGGNIQKPRISGFGSAVYCLQVNNRSLASRSSFTVDDVHYETRQIYCPTVPTQAFYTRRNGKIWISGNSNYWGKPPNMSKQSHIDLGLVQHYQDVYFSVFPEIRQWHNWIIEQVQVHQEFSTIFGRVRRFLGRPSEDATIREAIAHDGQSPAADYTNSALIQLHKSILKKTIPATLFLQKHDEIGVRFLETDQETVLPKLRTIMEQHYTLTAPNGSQRDWYVPVEAQIGWNLGHANENNPNGLTKWPEKESRIRIPNTNSVLSMLSLV